MLLKISDFSTNEDCYFLSVDVMLLRIDILSYLGQESLFSCLSGIFSGDG